MKINEEYFKYLEYLNKKENVKMFDTVNFLMEKFNLKEKEAKNVVLFWAENRDTITGNFK